MKNSIATLAVFASAFALSACGSSNETSETAAMQEMTSKMQEVQEKMQKGAADGSFGIEEACAVYDEMLAEG